MNDDVGREMTKKVQDFVFFELPLFQINIVFLSFDFISDLVRIDSS